MSHENRGELVELGLSPTEAQVYLALIQNASLSARALAGLTDLSRSRVYQTLCSLTDKGLVESGAGYGSKFAVVAADHALPALIEREQETLAQRKDLAARVGQRLAALAEPVESAPEELIQIIRNPKVVTERFRRLQLEAERQVDVINKRPFLSPRQGNPAQKKAQRRGVRYRALYERAALDDPAIAPFVAGWIAAGEESRVCRVEPPHKLAIFDAEAVMMPLIMPGDQTRTLIIRHPQLAQSLSMLFEFLWERAEPVRLSADRHTIDVSPVAPTRRNNHDGELARA
jgi:sugar-specific transcriptional regulator TrmB